MREQMRTDGTSTGFANLDGPWGPNALLAWDTIALKETRGIPTMWLNLMEHSLLEEFSGSPPGSYRKNPEEVYLGFQLAAGVCLCDQWIPRNPLTMGTHGFESDAPRGAATGAHEVIRDGMRIDSPEDVVAHLERIVIPNLEKESAALDGADPAAIERKIGKETEVQRLFGPNMLKSVYGASFPHLAYSEYGYENYFMAYALYPEVMERCFRLQGDRGALLNEQTARAVRQGHLPAMIRLDHDMADARGTLCSLKSLDTIWFPHFARAIAPLVKEGLRLIWHCDGNLMQMVPRLIEAGVSGFQGFQYEQGMDYDAICRMTSRDGGPLIIWAGVSVTTTLPLGSPSDVAEALKRLVAAGPCRGLFLGPSSSIVPGTPRENVKALLEGLHYYREGEHR